MLYSFLSVSFGLILGRLSGFYREIFIAANLGASQTSDLVILLLTTPDFLVNLLVGGALSMALIPEFKSLGKEKAKTLYVQVLFSSGFMFLIISLLLSINSNHLLGVLAPGIKNLISIDVENFFRLSLFSIPFTVLSGVTTAYLHYKEKFLIASLGTLIFNVIVLIFLKISILYNTDILLFVAVGVVFASFFRFLIFNIKMDLHPIKCLLNKNLISPNLIGRYFQCIFSGGFFFIIPVALRSFSSNFGESEISIINYSTKLVEFPLGVLITVFSVIFFPKLAKIYSEGDKDLFSSIATKILCLVFFVSISSMLPLYFHSDYYIGMIFGHSDEFSDSVQCKMSLYLAIYALSIPMQGVNSMLIAALSAQKNTKYPLYSSLLSILFFIILATYFSFSVKDLLNFVVLTYLTCTILLLFFSVKFSVICIDNKILYIFLINILLVVSAFLYFYFIESREYLILFDSVIFLTQSALTIFLCGRFSLKEKNV
ncbi:hypothetical protein F0225_02980 [Vibrio pectenicida]|uniref:Murein biosynthesis integral membrane protein MurJ n=1 Tax=Vibrio pectenicida TaxID=62763 RepID=A0A7Y3ZWE6_9VIBR|nr:lipid II flippase MurJ [Vibrio pectenicida]NOH70305.1 hypothetical protein [Vibrio pectenicida]